MKRRAERSQIPTPPTVPELVDAPELATVILLEHALDVVREAMLAEHPTLVDELRRPSEDGPVVVTANTICLRAIALRDTLRRYRRAVREAAALREGELASDNDLDF